MNQDTLESTREFFAVASRHGMLPADTVHGLQQEAVSRQLEGASLVLQKGLMTALDVQIVETLRQPLSAIPGYEIQTILGRGGMGVVYRARQVALDRTVALKMVLVGLSSNPSMLARFEQEAQTVGRLLHPHIITAYDFGRHDGRLYFAMEFVEGEDAEQYVERHHPLSEQQVWLLIRQAASGLAHAAESGIVHRDIKPANLLLVPPPKGYPLPTGTLMVKIADFGLAFLSAEVDEKTRLTSEQSTLGSPNYMAPEQFNAGHVVDHRADIYSLGATAFHLLAGQAPFDGKTIPQIVAQKLSDEPPSLNSIRSDLSADSLRLIEQMLARDPDKRICSYAELLDRIDTLEVMSAAQPTIAYPPKTEAVTPPGVRTPIWKSWIALACAGAVLAGVIAAAIFWRPATTPIPAINLRETGWSAELFDGQSLRGWRPQSGNWTVDHDDEGGSIIAGTGEILRPLMKPASGDRIERLTLYRLTLAAQLHEATAIELQFNVGKTGIRDVLRLTRDQTIIGQRSDAKVPLKPVGEPKSSEIGTDRLHEIRLERCPLLWRVFVDDALAGSFPVSQPELPEFHLVAEGGSARFSDLFVQELSVADKTP